MQLLSEADQTRSTKRKASERQFKNDNQRAGDAAVTTSGSEKVQPSANATLVRKQETEAKCWVACYRSPQLHSDLCFYTPAWKHSWRLRRDGFDSQQKPRTSQVWKMRASFGFLLPLKVNRPEAACHLLSSGALI